MSKSPEENEADDMAQNNQEAGQVNNKSAVASNHNKSTAKSEKIDNFHKQWQTDSVSKSADASIDSLGKSPNLNNNK